MKLRFLFFLLIPIFVFFLKKKKSQILILFFHSINDNESYHSLKLKYGISKRKILKWNPRLKKM